MKKFQLGEFEEIVMLTVAILYENAYGVSIKKEIESRLNRSVSVGALQSALRRLEDKDSLRKTRTRPRNVQEDPSATTKSLLLGNKRCSTRRRRETRFGKQSHPFRSM